MNANERDIACPGKARLGQEEDVKTAEIQVVRALQGLWNVSCATT